MRLASTILALVTVLPAVAAEDNWPQFRGPGGAGQSSASGLPLKWGEKENVRWKTRIHDKGWSSPVVWGDQVWLTTAEEKGHAFFAVCVDRKSGSIIHDLKLATAENPPDIIKYNSF